MKNQDKPFLDHLEDLRWVVIKSAVALGAGMIAGCAGVRWIVMILREPLEKVLAARGENPEQFLVTLGVTDPLIMMIQVGLFAGFIIACPFIFYFVGNFLLPVFTSDEQKVILPAFAAGGVLFLTGILFCYYIVLPAAVGFFLDFNAWLGWEPFWTIQKYLSFVLQMLIAFGVSFELPLVILVLARIGIVSSKMLRECRRHAVIILLIFAAAVTPTGDPFNLALLFVPMYVLFEVSIIGAGLVGKRKLKPEMDQLE